MSSSERVLATRRPHLSSLLPEREGNDRISDLAAVGVHGRAIVWATIRRGTEVVSIGHVPTEGIGDELPPVHNVDARGSGRPACVGDVALARIEREEDGAVPGFR